MSTRQRRIRHRSERGCALALVAVTTRWWGRRRPLNTRVDSDELAVPQPHRQRPPGRSGHDGQLASARSGSEDLVRAGYNTGAVPYGYRPHRVRVIPPGRRPRWRVRLVIEPAEAATVKMIFAWRGEDGLTIAAIRQRLLAARYPSPLDAHTGQPCVWTCRFIRTVLHNPKYLGRQFWGRHHHGRRAPRTSWVWSPVWAHPPIVTAEEFSAANRHSRLIAGPPFTADRRRAAS